MFERKGKRRRSWGFTAFVVLALAVFALGLWKFGTVIHTQLQWKQFQLQYAACTYDVGAEGGWLRADDGTEAVRVCSDNASLVFRMIQTGKAVSLGAVKAPQRQITLTFSDGGYGVLSEVNDGGTHVDFTDMAGKRWLIWLGKCDFHDLVTLLSAEGAAYENAPWTD